MSKPNRAMMGLINLLVRRSNPLPIPVGVLTMNLLVLLASCAIVMTASTSPSTRNRPGGISRGDVSEKLDIDTTEPLTLHTFGGPPDLKRNSARDVVAERWGIRYRTVAGCTPSTEVYQLAQATNARIEPMIAARFGEEWYLRFRSEVDSELEKQMRVRRVLERQPQLRRKDRELGLYYRLLPVEQTSLYQVDVYGWAKVDGKDSFAIVTYFTLRVDYRTGRIDSLMKLYPPPASPVRPTFD